MQSLLLQSSALRRTYRGLGLNPFGTEEAHGLASLSLGGCERSSAEQLYSSPQGLFPVLPQGGAVRLEYKKNDAPTPPTPELFKVKVVALHLSQHLLQPPPLLWPVGVFPAY